MARETQFNTHGGYAEGPKNRAIGGTGDAAGQVKKVGEIDMEIGHLTGAITELEEAVDCLLRSIEPVLACAPDGMKDAGDRAARSTPLANRLYEQVLRIQSVSERAHRAIGRVEL